MTDQVTGSGVPEPSGSDWEPGDPVYPEQAPGYLDDLDGMQRCAACGTPWVISVSGVQVTTCPVCTGWRFTPAGSRTGRPPEPELPLLPSWRDLDAAEPAEPDQRWGNYQRWRERYVTPRRAGQAGRAGELGRMDGDV